MSKFDAIAMTKIITSLLIKSYPQIKKAKVWEHELGHGSVFNVELFIEEDDYKLLTAQDKTDIDKMVRNLAKYMIKGNDVVGLITYYQLYEIFRDAYQKKYPDLYPKS